ncbi:GPP34 family phosphoprotein [Jannaschia sp. R86511]|uniref:GPP34 family phosphoprotein n=1 Tax=Jannaschia sp. R86511 TaxID=3093853 RepID=UPI0036D37D58
MTDPVRPARPAPRDRLDAQLLLLAVGDRARFTTRGDVRTLVAAAAVAEQVLAGRALAEVLDLTAAPVQDHLRPPATQQALDTAARVLVEAGRIEPRTHKVLGLFARNGFAVTDPAARAQVEQHLAAALVPDRYVPTRDAALAALASVGGLARQHVRPRSRAERDALRAHLNGLAPVLGPDLLQVVRGLRRAYARTGSDDPGVLVVPGSDRDGFGDQGGQGSADGGGDGGDGGGGGD